MSGVSIDWDSLARNTPTRVADSLHGRMKRKAADRFDIRWIRSPTLRGFENINGQYRG